MPIRGNDISSYFEEVMGYFRRLATNENRVINQLLIPHFDVDCATLTLPQDYLFLDNDSPEAIDAYVDNVLVHHPGGIVFQDRAIASIRLGLDVNSSTPPRGLQPRFFSYLYAKKQDDRPAFFLRIEMDPERRGNSFSHPVIHVHWPLQDARLSLGRSVSPVEFVDFILRCFYPEAWMRENNSEDNSILQVIDRPLELARLGNTAIEIDDGFEASVQQMDTIINNQLQLSRLENHQILGRFPFAL